MCVGSGTSRRSCSVLRRGSTCRAGPAPCSSRPRLRRRDPSPIYSSHCRRARLLLQSWDCARRGRRRRGHPFGSGGWSWRWPRVARCGGRGRGSDCIAQRANGGRPSQKKRKRRRLAPDPAGCERACCRSPWAAPRVCWAREAARLGEELIR